MGRNELRPYGFNPRDAVQMVGHDHMDIQRNAGKSFRQTLPHGNDGLAGQIQSRLTVHHFTETG